MFEDNFNFRTDMADERVDTYKKVHNLSDIDGIEVSVESGENIDITIVNVINENGAKSVAKEIGKYITIQIQDLKYLEDNNKENIIKKIAYMIRTLIDIDKIKSTLIVGLGNIYVTPDSLGPKVIQNISITRHLLNFTKEVISSDTRSISAISPGVLGTTGIETSEIVTAIVNKIKVDQVIVIDSLASQSVDRVGNTIQLSNTGITPGAGVKNDREGINFKTLGIPVIAVGVPTVVDMATITEETISKVIENIDEIEQDKAKEIFSENISREKIASVLDTQNYIVTPKEIDEVIENVSKIISKGINKALDNN